MATHASAEVRRAQILEAALECFGESGLHAAKVSDIASASGLSKGAIYWHFKSKEEIFLALFDSITDAIFAQWDQAESDDALTTLERFGEAAIERLLETRPLLDAWTEFLRHPGSRRRMGDVYAMSRVRLAAVLVGGMESGRVKVCDAEATAGALTGLIEGLLLQALADPEFDPRPAWRESWRLLASALSV